MLQDSIAQAAMNRKMREAKESMDRKMDELEKELRSKKEELKIIKTDDGLSDEKAEKINGSLDSIDIRLKEISNILVQTSSEIIDNLKKVNENLSKGTPVIVSQQNKESKRLSSKDKDYIPDIIVSDDTKVDKVKKKTSKDSSINDSLDALNKLG